jgi:FMN phosphatase YigB (HAD superfamily)
MELRGCGVAPTFNHPDLKRRLSDLAVVFFDWKGTLELVPSNRTAETKRQRLLKPLLAMLETGREHYPTLLASLSGDRCWEIYLAEKQRLGTTGTFSLKTLVYNVIDLLGVKDTTSRQAMYEAYFRVSNENKRVLMEGAVELLEKLRQAGRYRVGLIRNSKQPEAEFSKILQRYQVDHFFEVVLLGGDLGYSKPNSKLFEAAVNALNISDLQRTAPHRILIVGNETEADIEGGKRMGWTTCLVRSTESTSGGLADLEVDTLRDLQELLFPA